MQIHPLSPDIRNFWKAFPLRIPGGSQCSDCGQDTVLVQSMNGGFVTRNCPKCNKPTTLPSSVFEGLDLWVACPQCKDRMESSTLPDKNYGYVCQACVVGIPLHAILPRWEDL